MAGRDHSRVMRNSWVCSWRCGDRDGGAGTGLTWSSGEGRWLRFVSLFKRRGQLGVSLLCLIRPWQGMLRHSALLIE